jgi:hypothetical protein
MDVMEGFVSREAARTQYGVVLKAGVEPHLVEMDAEATRKLRAEMKKAR